MARLDWEDAEKRDKVRDRGGEPVNEPKAEPFVSRADRERMRKARAQLLQEFRSLGKAERTGRSKEFRGRLKDCCPSHSAFIGAWTAQYEPLLPAGYARSGTPGAKVAKAPKREREPSKIARAAVALVKAGPAVIDQRTCVDVLAGTASDTVKMHGLRHAAQFRQFKGTDRDKLHEEVKQAVADGLLRERADRTLRAA